MTRFPAPLKRGVFATPPEGPSEGRLAVWLPNYQKRQHPSSGAVSGAPEGHLGLGRYSAGSRVTGDAPFWMALLMSPDPVGPELLSVFMGHRAV